MSDGGKGSARRPGVMPEGAWEQIFTKPNPSVVIDKCRHEWPQGERGVDMNSCCTKCGKSFQRYILTECP